MNLPRKENSKRIISNAGKSNKSHILKYIPNMLTTSRLLGTPFILWFIVHQQWSTALLWFFVISLTDWFDGYLARRWDAFSKLGQILDPIADKFLIISVYLVLGLWGFIPFWLTLIVVIRDFLILFVGSSIIFTRKGQIQLPPHRIGKISTTLQLLFIGFLLINGDVIPSFPTSSIRSIVMVSFLYIVAIATILSGIAYAKVAIKAFRKS